MGLLGRILVVMAAIAIAAYFVPGISWGKARFGFGRGIDPYVSLGLTALALSIVNAVIRPILVLLTLPITAITLGLFLFVINALMLMLVAKLPFLGFRVAGFVPALIASLVISLVGIVANRIWR